ncbi:MAG TPA: hypothetical protein VK986_19815 [Tepidisphaeraceae bacterium]|nr:hypothetical protein [Tepidisphaeraceae bacterium]
MRDDRDYKLELSSLASTGGANSADAQRTPRPHVHVQFDCCNVYLRIYRDPADTEYRGRCPKCGNPVVLKVGQGGTSARFFRVT